MLPISFEFFPPKTDEQRAQLDRTATLLKARGPEYASVTFGAGGSTLSYTGETVARLHREHGIDVAPHLSCMGGTRREIAELLDGYRAAGYRRRTAVRPCRCSCPLGPLLSVGTSASWAMWGAG